MTASELWSHGLTTSIEVRPVRPNATVRPKPPPNGQGFGTRRGRHGTHNDPSPRAAPSRLARNVYESGLSGSRAEK